jgi:hypothetical protein
MRRPLGWGVHVCFQAIPAAYSRTRFISRSQFDPIRKYESTRNGGAFGPDNEASRLQKVRSLTGLHAGRGDPKVAPLLTPRAPVPQDRHPGVIVRSDPYSLCMTMAYLPYGVRRREAFVFMSDDPTRSPAWKLAAKREPEKGVKHGWWHFGSSASSPRCSSYGGWHYTFGWVADALAMRTPPMADPTAPR